MDPFGNNAGARLIDVRPFANRSRSKANHYNIVILQHTPALANRAAGFGWGFRHLFFATILCSH
jgi:hypothetical protein